MVDPIHEAVKKSNGQLRVVFKHFPLTSIHPYARPAAKAAIAAQMQGKFWRFHDRLFKNQKRLTDTDLLTWAKVEGLDLERLKADMNSPAADKQLKADMAQAGKAGVRGTPTTFINGRKLKTSPSSADALLDIIHAEILKE